jgi:hypothetical protein
MANVPPRNDVLIREVSLVRIVTGILLLVVFATLIVFVGLDVLHMLHSVRAHLTHR